ncbi:MAG: hypothetical protein MK212_21110, partial [Saprospiraceae bacterium]|nr:hypothetical protein [Saprospiraceae bacterium]
MYKYTTNNVDSQFLRNSKVVDFFIAVVEWASWKFLAITTAVLAFSLFDSFLQAHVPHQYIMWGRALGIVLIFLLVDAGLDKMLAYHFKEKQLMKKDYNNSFKKQFLKSIGWLITIRILLTATSSLWAAPATSGLITKDNQASSYTNQISSLDRRDSLELVQATTLLNKLKINEQTRIANAENFAKSAFQKAYKLGDRYQRASYDKEGYGWICNRVNRDPKDQKYCKQLKEATREGKDKIAYEKRRVSELEASITLSPNPIRDSMRLSLASLATSANQQYLRDFNNNKNIIYILDFFAVLLGIATTRLRVKRRLAAGDHQEGKKNLLFLLGQAGDKIKQNAINWIEDQIGLNDNKGDDFRDSHEQNLKIKDSSPLPQKDELQKMINDAIQNNLSQKRNTIIPFHERSSDNNYDNNTHLYESNVATNVATFNMNNLDIEITAWINLYRKANSDLSIQRKRKQTDTVKENIQKLMQIFETAEQKLKELGLNPEEILVKRTKT